MTDENKKQTKTKLTGHGHTGAYRMNARSVLNEKIKRVKEEFLALETLSRRIPWDELSVEEEQELWHYFVRN